MQFAIDITLAGLLLVATWQTFRATHLPRAVVWFVAFGLVLALIWVRLEVFAIALAEAMVGAGVTGWLMHRAIQSLPASNQDKTSLHPNARWLPLVSSIAVWLTLMAVVGLRPNTGMPPSQLFGDANLRFASLAAWVIAIAVFWFFRQPHLLKRLFALNLIAAGVFLFMISMARHLRDLDTVAQALVLTGMAISLAATSLALHIFTRYYHSSRSMTLSMAPPKPPKSPKPPKPPKRPKQAKQLKQAKAGHR